MPITNYGASMIVKSVIGKSVSSPATLYIALMTAGANTTSTGVSLNEPTGGSYARIGVSNASTEWTFDGYNLMYNTNDVTFATATGYWGRIGYWAVCDAATAGNVIAFGTLNPVANIVSGDRTKLLAGSISFSVFDPSVK